MATIYELTSDYESKLSQLGEMLIDGGNVTNEQAIELLDLQDNIGEKVINIGKFVKNLDASSDAIAKEVARLTAKKRGIDNHIKALKDASVAAMTLLNVDKVHDDIMPVRLQDNSQYSVTVDDINRVPEYYKKITVAVDKAKILSHGGGNIKGVTVTKGRHIRFG